MSFEKLSSLQKDLSRRVIGQDDMAMAMTLGLLAREHVAVIGPPGEGKTMMANMVPEYFDGWGCYYHLLTRYTTPDEVVGHYSVAKLQKDIYERRTDGKAPTAEIVVLDEVFKANSPMLNSLLGMLNERVVDGIPCKLQTLLGCSNEYPSAGYGDDAVGALWDRFLIRLEISRAGGASLRSILCGNANQPASKFQDGTSKIKEDEIKEAQLTVSKMAESIDEKIVDALLKLKGMLEIEGVDISTRRMVKAIKVIAAFAYLNNRSAISHRDLGVLSFVLWDKPEDKEPLGRFLSEIGSPVQNLIQQVRTQVWEFREKIDSMRGVDRTTTRYEFLRWIKTIGKELGQVESSDPLDKKELEEITDWLRAIHSGVMTDLSEEEVEF